MLVSEQSAAVFDATLAATWHIGLKKIGHACRPLPQPSAAEGLLRAGALPFCAPAADGNAGLWSQFSPHCQQISN